MFGKSRFNSNVLVRSRLISQFWLPRTGTHHLDWMYHQEYNNMVWAVPVGCSRRLWLPLGPSAQSQIWASRLPVYESQALRALNLQRAQRCVAWEPRSARAVTTRRELASDTVSTMVANCQPNIQPIRYQNYLFVQVDESNRKEVTWSVIWAPSSFERNCKACNSVDAWPWPAKTSTDTITFTYYSVPS